MTDRSALEALFLEHLPFIERFAAKLARRHGLRGEDVADFVSWVTLRLVEDDYATLRKFRGESAVDSYLAMVIANLVRDDRVQRWGRWRPSAEAIRRGPVAVRLELLVYRQGCTLDEAAERLRSAGETTMSTRELGALLARLPRRRPLRPGDAGPEPIAVLPGGDRADAFAWEEERERVHSVLEQAIGELPLEDRLILRAHFWSGATIAQVARGLALEQKPLYRRVERLLAALRRRLTTAGVSRERVGELLDEEVDAA